ncbi:MAG: hypothetical protein LBO63_05910 [Oscillospiraceae bacterium]|jgi:hypothetical protein|nr:hypothetical protein [Oscillospiraceae bacterium]
MDSRKKTGKKSIFGKITAMALTFALLLAAVPVAHTSAANGAPYWYPPQIVITAQNTNAPGNGNQGRVVKGNDFYSQKSYSRPTGYDGIRASADGYYAMEYDVTGGKETVPVGRLDIDLCDTDAVSAAMERTDISAQAKAAIFARHEQALANGVESLTTTLFSSDLLYDDGALAAQLSAGSNSLIADGLLAYKSAGAFIATPLSTVSTTYYTYNGSSMKSEKMYTNGLNTGWQYVQRGATTGTTAGNIFSAIITIGGATIKTVPIPYLAAAISLLQSAINQIAANTISGHTSDFLQVRIIYNDVQQWTYLNAGGEWLLGLASQQVTVTQNSSEQYYYNAAAGGRTFTSNRTVNVVTKTDHFDSPWAYAYQYAYNPRSEGITAKVGSKTLYF